MIVLLLKFPVILSSGVLSATYKIITYTHTSHTYTTHMHTFVKFTCTHFPYFKLLLQTLKVKRVIVIFGALPTNFGTDQSHFTTGSNCSPMKLIAKRYPYF